MEKKKERNVEIFNIDEFILKLPKLKTDQDKARWCRELAEFIKKELEKF